MDRNLESNVNVLSSLPYDELIGFYKSALALLIPMSNNLQDQGRFPFKICEYLASGRPIITSNSHLINEYFIDRETALIANLNDVNSFKEHINVILKNEKLACEIGKKAYQMGKNDFDFNVYSSKIHSWLTD